MKEPQSDRTAAPRGGLPRKTIRFYRSLTRKPYAIEAIHAIVSRR